MKHIALLVALATLALPLAAQTPGPSTGAPRAQAQQKVKDPAAKEAKRRAMAKLDEQSRKALKLMGGAQKALLRALPIYDGHRTLAVQLIKTSRIEVLMGGIQSSRKAKKTKAAKNEGHETSSLSRESVAQSQKAMSTARDLLEKAIASLAAAPNQSAYTTEAIANLGKAKQEVMLGIAVHSSKP